MVGVTLAYSDNFLLSRGCHCKRTREALCYAKYSYKGFIGTEMRYNLCTWLGEISSCSCLTVLPGPAWVLLNKICKE